MVYLLKTKVYYFGRIKNGNLHINLLIKNEEVQIQEVLIFIDEVMIDKPILSH